MQAMSLLALFLAQAAAAQAAGHRAPNARAPAEIVAAAPATAWAPVPAEDLLVMELPAAPTGAGPRRIVIQLVPAPFARPWIANIHRLAAAHWWDGLSVNRVQDNYVVQWGDANEKKPLPPGLASPTEADYAVDRNAIGLARTGEPRTPESGASLLTAVDGATPAASASADVVATRTASAPQGWHQRDGYAPLVEFVDGWPVASDGASADARVWPVHCYGSVGVGRNVSPDAGSGAELYAVIGHAPRHLDRNIAVVGRVIAGIEHLSALPRGTEALGFYRTPGERTAITSIRLAVDLPAAQRPRYEYLKTDTEAFARVVAARANRKDDFFIRPAGGVDICNLPVPIRPIR